MGTCPTCDQPVGDAPEESCPACGVRPQGSTEKFPAVPGGADRHLEAREESQLADGPVLVVRKGPDVGERFIIDREQLTLGRDPSSGIFLNDVTVSRNHATLTYGGGEVSVEDAGSLNGTYINGVRVDRAPLKDGDIVQIGTFQMVFMGGGRT